MSTSNSSYLLSNLCTDRDSIILFIAITATKTILSLPLCTLVLYLCHQRWRQQRSFKTTSHSDIFTYHMVAMELIWVLGCFLYICGIYANLQIMFVGICATSTVFYGEIFFHLLTCVERYLAVVHPVTYRGLRNGRGVTIRNVSIGCVWLMCFGSIGVTFLFMPLPAIIPFFCLFIVSIIVVSFCSLSVLCALIRPGPGEGGGERERVDQSKRRAFHTITAITGVLWLWFLGVLVSAALFYALPLSQNVGCVVMASASWFNLPSSLVSPLLYLHRAGKLSCCCYNNE